MNHRIIQIIDNHDYYTRIHKEHCHLRELYYFSLKNPKPELKYLAVFWSDPCFDSRNYYARFCLERSTVYHIIELIGVASIFEYLKILHGVQFSNALESSITKRSISVQRMMPMCFFCHVNNFFTNGHVTDKDLISNDRYVMSSQC